MTTLRWLTAGESHGPALTAVLEGMVAGVSVTSKEVSAQLARRRLGNGRGARMSLEADEIEVSGGLRHGLTLGGPVAMRIANSDWPKWETVMAADPVEPAVLEGRARNAPLTRPRPGHADLAGMTKYGFDEARPVLERASARETAAKVAPGTVATDFLPRALATIDVGTGDAGTAHHQRSDLCAVPAAGVVAEALVALVLADATLEKFGGDSVTETSRNATIYRHGVDPLRTVRTGWEAAR